MVGRMPEMLAELIRGSLWNRHQFSCKWRSLTKLNKRILLKICPPLQHKYNHGIFRFHYKIGQWLGKVFFIHVPQSYGTSYDMGVEDAGLITIQQRLDELTDLVSYDRVAVITAQQSIRNRQMTGRATRVSTEPPIVWDSLSQIGTSGGFTPGTMNNFITGSWGSGKTMLATTFALNVLKNREVTGHQHVFMDFEQSYSATWLNQDGVKE